MRLPFHLGRITDVARTLEVRVGHTAALTERLFRRHPTFSLLMTDLRFDPAQHELTLTYGVAAAEAALESLPTLPGGSRIHVEYLGLTQAMNASMWQVDSVFA